MKPKTKPYDKNAFFWAVMYRASTRCKPHIVCIYPQGNDARVQVNRANHAWKEQGMGDWHWSVKRFMYRFRGAEIDAYDHEWIRNEKP